MDDIYGNLENYDEVNTIAELRSENKDLKNKLEEYATAMNKLQKDFDNLNIEFKKLEYNYSSLLKTARLEIERKTKIIANLNIEKDMMVLNSIQNANNRSMLNMRSSITNDRQSFSKTNQDSDCNIGKTEMNTKQLKSCKKLKNHDIARKEDSQTPSEDVVTSTNATITSRLMSIANKVIENIDSCSDRNSESKENITHNKSDRNDRAKPRKLIKNRRKSMPAVSLKNDKFNSNEDDSHVRDAFKRDFSSRGKTDRQIVDRNSPDKQSNKTSEPSGMDDKNSGYSDSSRDIRKSRSSRYDNGKYKNKDKSSQRHKRPFGPVRLHRKGPRDYQDDHHRHRILESPPHDKFDNYQRRNREHRPDYDRSHAYDHERSKHRHQERYPIKHKIPSDYDEPINKRLKPDSDKRPHEDITRWHYANENKEKQAVEQFAFLEETSCQSPDYIHTDAQSMYSIKEIRHTAITQLEDPRITSIKYNISKSNNGKVLLSTVVGRNVDMTPVDKSQWGIKLIDMPDALVQQPLLTNEELVKEIYMDIEIENPVLNSSMESGEICFDTEQVDAKSCQKGKENDNSKIHDNSENGLPSMFGNYKIPKLKPHDEIIQKQILPEKKNPSGVPLLTSCDLNTKYRENTNSICYKNRSQIKQDENDDNTLHQNENKKQAENINFEHQNKEEIPREIVESDLALSDDTSDYTEFQGKVTKQVCIQPASDNIEFQIQIMEQGIKNQSGTNNEEQKWKTAKGNTNKYAEDHTQAHITKQNKKYQTDSHKIELQDQSMKLNNQIQTIDYSNKQNDSSYKANTKKSSLVEKHKDAIMESSNKAGDQHILIKKKITEHKSKELTNDDSKKHKGKKKPQKHKENNTNNCLEIMDIPQAIDNKTGSKNDKVTKSKEIKNKFDDLFGDSSSLITPEDLGVVTQQGSSLPAPDYVPIYEDAQDAYTLNNIKESTLVQIPPQSEKVALIESDYKTEAKANTATSKDIKEYVNKSNIIDEKTSVPIEVTQTIGIYSNLISDTSSIDTDVVKTIILSSGVQPQCTLENCVMQDVDTSGAETRVDLNVINDDQNENDIRTTCQGTSLHMDALATSTPQKVLQLSNNLDKISDSSCNLNKSTLKSLDNGIRQLDNSDTNTINDADVPDVRIISQSFYRRRRRVTKKT